MKRSEQIEIIADTISNSVPWQHQHDERLKALIKQTVKTFADYSLIGFEDYWDLDAATGTHLTELADTLANIPRIINGLELTDEELRFFTKAQILINNLDGFNLPNVAKELKKLLSAGNCEAYDNNITISLPDKYYSERLVNILRSKCLFPVPIGCIMTIIFTKTDGGNIQFPRIRADHTFAYGEGYGGLSKIEDPQYNEWLKISAYNPIVIYDAGD